MKKKTFLILFVAFFLASSTIYAQKVTGCGFKVPPRSLIKPKFQSVYEARAILNSMLDTIQWKENFSVREQNGIRTMLMPLSSTG